MSNFDSSENYAPDDEDLYHRHLHKLEGNGYGGSSGEILPRIILHRCKQCGSTDLLPSGTCHVCRVCGATTGCS